MEEAVGDADGGDSVMVLVSAVDCRGFGETGAGFIADLFDVRALLLSRRAALVEPDGDEPSHEREIHQSAGKVQRGAAGGPELLDGALEAGDRDLVLALTSSDAAVGGLDIAAVQEVVRFC